MLYTVHIILFSLLLLIFIQDMKFRAVSWLAFPVLFAVGVWYSLSIQYNLNHVFTHLGMNLLFLMVQFFVVSLYFSLKERRFVNILKAYLGLGDVLFLVSIAALFSPFNFILFYLISIVLVAAIHLLVSLFTQVNPKIPLAGMQAIMLIVVLILCNFILDINTYQDDWLYT